MKKLFLKWKVYCLKKELEQLELNIYFNGFSGKDCIEYGEYLTRKLEMIKHS